MNFINTHCMICNDAKHFESKVWDVERISSFLERYVKTRHIEDERLWQKLKTDYQTTHFMCGSCMKVDKTKLRRVEERLHRAVYSVIMDIRDDKKIPVHDILRSLQGYYPLLYTYVEREYRNKKEN